MSDDDRGDSSLDKDAQLNLEKHIARIERDLATHILSHPEQKQAPWWFLLAVIGGGLALFCAGVGVGVLLKL